MREGFKKLRSNLGVGFVSGGPAYWNKYFNALGAMGKAMKKIPLFVKPNSVANIFPAKDGCSLGLFPIFC